MAGIETIQSPGGAISRPVSVFQTASLLTPAQVNTITAPEQTFTIPGAPASSAVLVTEDGAPTANVPPVHARRSAANTVAITWVNPTAGNLTPAAGATYRLVFFVTD